MTRSRVRSRASALATKDVSEYTDSDWGFVIKMARNKLSHTTQLDYGRVFLNYAKIRGWNDHETRSTARLSYSTFLVNTILAPFDKDNGESRKAIYRDLCWMIDQGQEFDNKQDPAISSIRKCKEWLSHQHVNLYQLISVIDALQRRETNPSQQIKPPKHFDQVYKLREWSEKKGYVFPRDALPESNQNACQSILRKFYSNY